MLKTKRETAKTYILVSHVFKTKVKEGPDYIFSVWCLVNYHINWEKLFFPSIHRARVVCYSLRKHECKLALNNAKKIHNCVDYF